MVNNTLGDAMTLALGGAGGAEEPGKAGCGNSFVADTSVLMADGSKKPIQEVKVGDKVGNAAPEGGKIEGHVVTAVHVTVTDTDFVSLAVETGSGRQTITVTAHHLFWDSTTHVWTTAVALRAGDKLDSLGTGQATVDLVWRFTSSIRTYNLTVDGLHTYLVEAGDQPVLVHNGTPCDLDAAALKPFEMDTAKRLMADPEYKGGKLRGFVEENSGEDYIDENGKTYDAIGTPKGYQRGDQKQFLDALYDHLYRKSSDFTVLDVTGASSAQIDTIFSHMDAWAKDAAPRSPAIIVGDY